MRPKLVVVDANSLIYRAFFAMPALTTADGVPTNAVYGYATMLLKLIEQEQPDVILVAQEGGRTFRHAAYDGYKAQRPRTPDDLARQAPLARELTAAFRIPIIEHPGYEADDVVGTLACAGRRAGYDVLIVTGDLDALQLVDPHVRVMVNRRGITDTVIYDEAAVRARFGLEPAQLPDYKALRGDSSDNIPGVAGIGEKTTTRLLQRFGSLEALLERLEEVAEPKVRGALEAADRKPLMYKNLAAIVTDLPLTIDFDAWRYQGPDVPLLSELCRRLEFNSLLRRVLAAQAADGQTAAEPMAEMDDAPTLTTQHADLVNFDWRGWTESARRHGWVAIRMLTKGTGTNTRLQAMALAYGPEAVTLGEASAEEPTPRVGRRSAGRPDATPALPAMEDASWEIPVPVRQLLEDPAVGLVGHDLKTDLHGLRRAGIAAAAPVFDSMVAAYLLQPGRSTYRLRDLARQQLGVTLDEEAEPLQRLGREAAALALMREPLEGRLRAEGLEALNRELEVPLIRILADMEAAGVRIDPDYLRRLSVELAGQIEALQQRIHQAAGQEFNIGSPKQLQQILFEKLQLKSTKKTPTGAPSTDVDVLEELAAGGAEIARLIVEYRELTKIKSTYVDALPALAGEDGRVHTSLNQTVAATGRLSSSEPNLQNIPIRTELGRLVRAAFVAGEEMRLLSADYSQIELRILAHVTGDPELTRAFTEDEDVHTRTAMRLFEVPLEGVTPDMRRRAKTINFAVIYGMSDFGLSRELGIPVASAREMIDAYFARFPGVVKYTKETLEQARGDGFVCTLSGRKRPMPEIHSANRSIRQNAERAAVNAPIQGTAADIIKQAMIRVDRALAAGGGRSRMILQVHDELLFETPPDEVSELAAIVRREMEAAFPMRVPLRVEIKVGENWRDITPQTG